MPILPAFAVFTLTFTSTTNWLKSNWRFNIPICLCIFVLILTSMAKTAILLGASGLIGSHLLERLLKSEKYSKLTIFVRKKLPEHPKLNQVITSFETLDYLSEVIDAEVIFCCLGSTKRKTPNQKDYRYVDYDIPLFFAQAGQKNGTRDYHLISAMGANATSLNFYSKMKGELEHSLKALRYQSLHIYRPSLLKGERSEERTMERFAIQVMKLADPLLFGPLKKYRSIDGKDVASAMFNESNKNKKGIFVHNSEQIKKLA